MRVIKLVSLTALLCLSVLLLFYNPPSSFSLDPLLYIFNRWPRIESVKQRIYDSIDVTVEELKLNVSNKQQHEYCTKYTKLSAQQQISISQECSFCNVHGQNSVSDVVYIHVLLREEQNLQNLHQFEQKLRSRLQINIKIDWEVLDTSILPQHLKDKIDNELYINIIAKQLENMRQSRHCRYTHQTCQSYTILTTTWQSLQEGYQQVGRISFTKIELIKQTILSLLGAQCLTSSALRRVIKINRLLHMKEQFDRLYAMMDNQQIQPNILYLEKKAQQIEKYVSGNTTSIYTSFLDDEDSADIDLFPSEYKIGVYLPIALIMIIFPCFTLLK